MVRIIGKFRGNLQRIIDKFRSIIASGLKITDRATWREARCPK